MTIDLWTVAVNYYAIELTLTQQPTLELWETFKKYLLTKINLSANNFNELLFDLKRFWIEFNTLTTSQLTLDLAAGQTSTRISELMPILINHQQWLKQQFKPYQSQTNVINFLDYCSWTDFSWLIDHHCVFGFASGNLELLKANLFGFISSTSLTAAEQNEVLVSIGNLPLSTVLITSLVPYPGIAFLVTALNAGLNVIGLTNENLFSYHKNPRIHFLSKFISKYNLLISLTPPHYDTINYTVDAIITFLLAHKVYIYHVNAQSHARLSLELAKLYPDKVKTKI